MADYGKTMIREAAQIKAWMEPKQSWSQYVGQTDTRTNGSRSLS